LILIRRPRLSEQQGKVICTAGLVVPILSMDCKEMEKRRPCARIDHSSDFGNIWSASGDFHLKAKKAFCEKN
jgi:hypothetical protein